MKKLASIFLAAALASSLLAVGTGAAGNEIKKGTAKVDGVLDDIYADSLVLTDLGMADNAYGTDWWYTCTADVYFLYDDANLYICAVVEDDDVLTKGEAFATGDNPYQNDNIEFRLSLDGNETETIKVAVDAYGYACYGLPAHYSKIDYSTIQYATTYTDTSYVVEVAIPCTKGNLNMITAGKLGFAYQLNDINADGKHVNHTTSFNGEAVKMPVFYNLSTETAKAAAAPAETTAAPVETTAAPVETTAAPAETTAAPAETTAAPAETTAPAAPEATTPAEGTVAPAETTAAPAETTAAPAPSAPSAPTTAPDTFDVLTVAGIITAASGAAFVLASKKH